MFLTADELAELTGLKRPKAPDYAKREAGWRVRAARLALRECVLPLDQLRGLPAATADTDGEGIYFMWYGPRLVYVGESNCIGRRLEQHMKEHTRATWLEVTVGAFRKAYESDYVRRYRPLFNRTRHG